MGPALHGMEQMGRRLTFGNEMNWNGVLIGSEIGVWNLGVQIATEEVRMANTVLWESLLLEKGSESFKTVLGRGVHLFLTTFSDASHISRSAKQTTFWFFMCNPRGCSTPGLAVSCDVQARWSLQRPLGGARPLANQTDGKNKRHHEPTSTTSP